MELTILDGGMGGEIQQRLAGAGHGLWSAKALMEQPALVTTLHREFIDAGAQIVTTNTYATVPSYLGKAALAHRYAELTGLAASLARQAADSASASNGSGRRVRVAGALPPLDESYRADLIPSAAEAKPVYETMVRAMVDDVDLLLCETMASAQEAHNAASAAASCGKGKPIFVSWTLDERPGRGLRSGETVAAAFAKLEGLEIDGYLFNCTHPEAMEVALAELSALTDKPLGCYPNRLNRVPQGWTLDNEISTGLREDLSEDAYVESIQRCIARGATIVGGCCGIGPRYIKALATRLAAH